ncbi:hypothetical protein [Colwellia psychrerythraea]|uniref:Uncharacterized protein n=1 Tax=Colwellia psychrerythraea TaxID=28229 RepID=A0A099KU99_COLPS|nr:hypothetical protein [Colwellia psychrerythraea]KGJ93765.1 hypothetical protein GAB14E_2320 [Colwellia psychrerythraea]
MANYMTQPMSAAKTIKITYYRKQSQSHPSHEETGAFTLAAESDYSRFNNIPADEVDIGTFKSSQGVPTAGKTHKI